MTDFGLGIFNEFWDGVHPHHLPFLHPHDSRDLTVSLQRLNAIIEKNSESSVVEGTRHLLADHNWRTHLVACFVLLRLSPQTRSALLDSFWERLTLGSWVSPQISVVLSLVDRDFKMKGEKILRDGLTANDPSLSTLGSQAPQGRRSPSEGKALAAVQVLINEVIIDTSDSDAGGLHAQHWKQRVLKLIETKIISCEIQQGTDNAAP